MDGIETKGRFADERDLQNVEHAVARILAETDSPVEVYGAVLAAIGELLGWELGAVWETTSSGRLRCVRTWHSGPGSPEFEAMSERITLTAGEGLPGRVLAQGTSAWIADVPVDANFPRAEIARRAGLRAAVGFPLRSPHGVVGVMEFFSHELREPDGPLVRTMQVLGSQIGQFITRRRAEEEVRAVASRLRAMLDSALDAVIAMDHRGRVLDWNHAAETTFGYRADETIGRDMADLIVPPSLRRAHRTGLARFLETEQPVALDRRLELRAMHKHGAEFPVELTITRVALPGPPVFTGFLRDITDRRRAEEELLDSRARLVEVADAERQRIQRNLHDGAQQRLTAVLLELGRLRESPAQSRELLEIAVSELSAALQEIRELASGLHPSVLVERGLAAALESLALRSPLPVELVRLPEARLDEHLEAAAYFVVAEALANAQKHAAARQVTVSVGAEAGDLLVEVADDGVGGADGSGQGLRGLADRVHAAGGEFEVESPAGGGTRLRARLPLPSA